MVEVTLARKISMSHHEQAAGIRFSQIMLEDILPVEGHQQHKESAEVIQLSIIRMRPNFCGVIQELLNVGPVFCHWHIIQSLNVRNKLNQPRIEVPVSDYLTVALSIVKLVDVFRGKP